MNWYVCVNEIFKCSKGWKVFLFYYSMFLVISGIKEIENNIIEFWNNREKFECVFILI